MTGESDARDRDAAEGGVWQRWFEGLWAMREDRVYRGLFGDLGSGVHVARAEHYERIGQSPRHPGWLHHGVFSCPPQPDRPHWVHVTSGLSNPWNLAQPGRDPTGESGLGFELCLCTPQPAAWAAPVLHHLMAWQLLVATGAVRGQPLGSGQRVPLGGAIDAAPDGVLSWVLVEAPDHFAPSFELPSGRVDWLLLVGVTDAEVRFARSQDQRALVDALRAAGVWPLTDVARGAVVQAP